MRWKSFRVVATAVVVAVSMLVILFAQFPSKPDNLLMATNAYADAGPKDTPEVIERFGCYPPKSTKCQPPPATVQQQVRRTLNQNGMGWAWPIAEAIISCETGGTWNEALADVDSNGYMSRGLWQVNDQYHGHFWSEGYRWDDAVDNTKVAILLYKGRQSEGRNGWSNWAYCARFWLGDNPTASK